MRQLITLAAALAAAALVSAGGASAGGFATVGVEPLPTGLQAGETWHAEITVLQHGRTPLTGLSPVLTIASGSGDTRDFRASPAGRDGVYAVDAVFPEAGRWTIAVETGWWGEGGLTFGPVSIADGGGAVSDPRSFPVVAVSAALLVAALAVLAAVSAGRRWRPSALGG